MTSSSSSGTPMPRSGVFGYRRVHVLIARGGMTVNHKRLYRLYRQAGLQVRRRRRKRLTRGERVPLPTPTRRGERWFDGL
jgi:putative transposase